MPENESNSEITRSKGKLIPRSVLVERAQKDFAEQINTGAMSVKDVKRFVKKYVTGVEVNGVQVLIMDFNYKAEKINPVAEAFIQLPKTKSVVAEYFYPEIRNNMERAGLLGAMKQLDPDYIYRLNTAENLANLCKDAGKSVAVVDMGNKPGYMVLRELFRFSTEIMVTAFGITRIQPELYSLLANPVWVANIIGAAGLLYEAYSGKGIFDKTKVNNFEKFILDFEQARRMYAARGIEQLTHEYPPTGQPGKEESQIVVMYPKAHGIRIADNLANPHRGLDKAKNVIYKLFGPGLDFSVRKWEWKNSLKKLAVSGYRWGKPDIQPTDDESYDSSDLENWRMVAEKKIEV
jgi:hypothetical protein